MAGRLWRWVRHGNAGYAAVAAACAAYLGYVWLAPISHVYFYVIDDALFYLQVGQNMASGLGVSFDGLQPTNGLHPLWALVGFAISFVFSSPEVALRAFFSVAVLCYAGSGGFIVSLLRRVAPGAALAGALVWVGSPFLVRAHVSGGMENSLVGVLLLGAVSLFVRFARQPSLERVLPLGVALGLLCLARVESVLLLPILGVAYLLVRRKFTWADFRYAAVTAGLFALVVAPAVIWSYSYIGHVTPINAYLKTNVYNPVELGMEGIVSFGDKAQHTVTHGAHKLAVINGALLNGFGSANRPWLLVVDAIAVLALVGLAWHSPVLRAAREKIGLELGILGAYAAVHFAGYAYSFPPSKNFIGDWYHEGLYIFWTLAAGILIFAAVRRWGGWRRASIVIIAVAYLAGVTALYHGTYFLRWQAAQNGDRGTLEALPGRAQAFATGLVDSHYSWTPGYADMGTWISRNLPADARIGSWTPGLLAYTAERSVVGLDGLVAGYDIVPYLKGNDVGEYIRRRGVTYLADCVNPERAERERFVVGTAAHIVKQPDVPRRDYDILYRGRTVASHAGPGTPACQYMVVRLKAGWDG